MTEQSDDDLRVSIVDEAVGLLKTLARVQRRALSFAAERTPLQQKGGTASADLKKARAQIRVAHQSIRNARDVLGELIPPPTNEPPTHSD